VSFQDSPRKYEEIGSVLSFSTAASDSETNNEHCAAPPPLPPPSSLPVIYSMLFPHLIPLRSSDFTYKKICSFNEKKLFW
jgi:hypothetical protein